MKTLRIVGLMVVLLATLSGSMETARATAPVTCWAVCSGIYYSGGCWLTLSECCAFNRRCPKPLVFEVGGCTDGQNSCQTFR